jgi:hypothetical protein
MRSNLKHILTLFMALVVQLTFAQAKSISGTVTDDAGIPLPGASIIVKGTSNGVQSDFDGKFVLSANTGDVLVISYVGLKTQEVTIGSSNDSFDVTVLLFS